MTNQIMLILSKAIIGYIWGRWWTLVVYCSFMFISYFYLLDDKNRVILPVVKGVENSDYINASYIDVSI
jgi:hypothetical protein